MMLEEVEHGMPFGSATVQFSHLLHSANEQDDREMKNRVMNSIRFDAPFIHE